jgi:hypothetical protein
MCEHGHRIRPDGGEDLAAEERRAEGVAALVDALRLPSDTGRAFTLTD